MKTVILQQIALNNWINRLVRQEWDEVAIEISTFILHFAVITLLFLVAKRLIDTVFKDRMNSRIKIISKRASVQRVKTLSTVAKNALTYVLYFIYAYALLNLFGFPIATLLASAGIAGVAFGLGAQSFVTDVISGFFMILENQMEVGDLVQIPEDDITGTVINTGIRTTTLKAANGNEYYIPNGEIRIINNMSRQAMQVMIELPLFDDMPFNTLKEVVARVTQTIETNYAEELQEVPFIVGVVRGEHQSFNYRVSFSVKNGEQYRLTSEFYELYFIALQENNIKFPDNTFDS